jgi:U3 small nucleolar ribonucleoprotein component
MQERVLELRFDNVVRVLVPRPEHVKAKTRKEDVELVDSKSKEGLADEYAKEYHTAVIGVTEDRHSKTREVCCNCACGCHSCHSHSNYHSMIGF